MKAYVAEKWCEPQELVYTDLPDPEPAEGELLIDIKASGMNFPDILLISGKYQSRPKRPFAPGAELAGEVIGIGAGVSGFQVGDRIAAVSMIGGYAEKAVVKATQTWKIPDVMSFEDAAGFMVTYQSSYFGVVVRGKAKAGENLLVHAGAGGIGSAAIQIGKALGMNVIATSGSEEKMELTKSIGADHALNYRDKKWSGKVRKELGGADVVIDPVGGDAFQDSLKCINFEGRIVVVGFTSGEIQQIPANMVLIKNCSVVGLFWNLYLFEHHEQVNKAVEQLLAWYVEGKLKPVIGKTLPLKDAPEALLEIGARKSTGKYIIIP